MNNDVPSPPEVKVGNGLQSNSALQSSTAGPRALLVDDDPLIRMLLAECLKTAGLRVTEAGNGVECLREVEAAAFDVIFMDIVMPEMDGIAATQELRKRGVKSWIVVVSSQQKIADTPLLDAAKAFGADDAMQKPFNLATITHEVQALLAKRKG